jgi:5-methylcytosine-specific restriction endonuclease McrA
MPWQVQTIVGRNPLVAGESPVTVDHIVPLAKSGGNTIDNVRPLCYSCNSKKGVNAEG